MFVAVDGFHCRPREVGSVKRRAHDAVNLYCVHAEADPPHVAPVDGARSRHCAEVGAVINVKHKCYHPAHQRHKQGRENSENGTARQEQMGSKSECVKVLLKFT